MILFSVLTLLLVIVYCLQISPGQTYVFNVFVVSHLGIGSENFTKSITRLADSRPLMVELEGNVKDVDPMKNVRLKAKTKKSKCSSLNLSGIEVSS